MTIAEFWMQLNQATATWVAALGTIGATFVALWLARAETRERNRERKLMRGTLIRLINEELNRLAMATLHDLQDTLEEVGNDPAGSGRALWLIRKLQNLAYRFQLPVTKEYIRLLPTLGESDCFKIASALTEATRIEHGLNRVANDYLQLQGSEPALLSGYLEDISGYRDNLIKALENLSWVEKGELKS